MCWYGFFPASSSVFIRKKLQGSTPEWHWTTGPGPGQKCLVPDQTITGLFNLLLLTGPGHHWPK